MKTSINILLILILNLYGSITYAQDIFAVDDSVCVDMGDPINYNVISNDIIGTGNYDFTDLTPLFFPNQTCVYLNQGEIEYNPVETCECGDYELVYELLDLESGVISKANVYLTIKCPEYDCSQNDPSCYAGQINISTGYDQVNGANLPPSIAGLNGASQDAEWILTGAPTNNGAVSLNSPAFVIPTNPSWDDIPGLSSRYLSAFQNNSSNQANISTTIAPYIYERKFCLCEASEITINKEVFADNRLLLTLEGNGITPVVLENLNTSDATNFQLPTVDSGPYITTLAAGEYKLVAEHRNDNPGSPMGFNINGTITSSNGSLLTAECCNNGSFITGYKFIDINCNGVFDGADYPGENWTIELKDANGNPLQSTTTDSNGYYSFSIPAPGIYLLNEILPPSTTQSFPVGNVHTVTIGAAQVISSVNFGNCICESIEVTSDPLILPDGSQNECCSSLSYANNFINLQGLEIRSNDADLNFTLSTLDPSLNWFSSSANSLILTSSINGLPIPQNVNNFIEMCIGEVNNSPQRVIIDWYDFDNEISCSDTLFFDCPMEPDCLYLDNDSIYCEGGQVFYDLTVCNPYTNTFDVSYIDFNVLSPPGIIITPSALTIPPLSPGNCYNTTIQLNGNNIGGDIFCYTLTAHNANPNEVDTALCCMFEQEYCVDIPICDPCEFVGIESVGPLDDSDCCYVIDIFNNFDPNFFDQIDVCVISPSTVIASVNNPFGSPWNTALNSSTSLSLYPTIGNLPLGVSSLPEICFSSQIAPSQQIEIKWLNQSEIVCRDTISIDCLPDCGYFTEDITVCSPFVPGLWDFSGKLFNNTPYQVDEVLISSSNSAVLGMAYSTSIPPYTSYSSINFNIGSPAQAGDTICFNVTMRSLTSDGNYIKCCNFEHCVVLPECDNGTPTCACDEEFFDRVNNGVICTQSTLNPLTYEFSMVDALYFGECDQLYWDFGDGNPLNIGQFNSPFTHTFPTSGPQVVCANVIRNGPNVSCKAFVCKTIVQENALAFAIAPNPGKDIFNIQPNKSEFNNITLVVSNLYGVEISSEIIDTVEKDVGVIIDLSDLSPGVYLVTISNSITSTSRRLVKL
ncbi:MAG: hypothetical protein ACI8XB_001969 [Patiriisocius sp.]|jgi:hypothetical protein